MYARRSCRGIAAIFVTAVVCALAVSAQSSQSQFASASLPLLRLAAGERIVGFNLRVTSGRIVQMSDVPAGWNISVDNDPSWNTKINASIAVASAAVDPPFFKDFIVIEREPGSEKPFAIAGEVLVSKDFSTVRRIKVGMKDFTMRAALQTPR